MNTADLASINGFAQLAQRSPQMSESGDAQAVPGPCVVDEGSSDAGGVALEHPFVAGGFTASSGWPKTWRPVEGT